MSPPLNVPSKEPLPLPGKDAENALVKAHITVNKNMVPFDDQSPFITSGIRIGTPAITTRGFDTYEAELITNWICDILDDINKRLINYKF